MPEIELKFELDAPARRRLVHARALAGNRSKRRPMASLYLDTPQCELARREMALRLRREGHRWVQTLKAGASGTGGLHARDEWEFDRPGPNLDLSLFAATPLAKVAAPATLHERLVPAFEVNFMRTTWQLSPAPGSRLEVALDAGAVESRGRREEISEVEIECLEGDPGAAFDLAALLLEEVALRPSAITKAARGYRLFRRTALRPQKAGRVHLDATLTPLAAARAVVAASLEQLQANEEGVLRSPAPEFVHQARIALRRMRSSLQLFREVIGEERAAVWRTQLGGAAAALGAARDWDVFATESLPPVAAAHGDRAAARLLEATVARRRRSAREAAREASPSGARSPRSRPRKPDPRTKESPVFESAEIGHKLKKSEFRREEPKLRMSPAERHQVRIDAKRLRYGVEGLASVFKARRVKRYVRGLTALQDALGRANDAATAQRLVAELDPSAPFAAFAQGWFAAREQGDVGLLQELVARLAQSKPFWRKKPAKQAAQT